MCLNRVGGQSRLVVHTTVKPFWQIVMSDSLSHIRGWCQRPICSSLFMLLFWEYDPAATEVAFLVYCVRAGEERTITNARWGCFYSPERGLEARERDLHKRRAAMHCGSSSIIRQTSVFASILIGFLPFDGWVSIQNNELLKHFLWNIKETSLIISIACFLYFIPHLLLFTMLQYYYLFERC